MKIPRSVGAALLCAAAALFGGCGNTLSDNDRASASSSVNAQASALADAAFSVPENMPPEQSCEITYFGSADIGRAAELFAKNSGGTVISEKSGGNYLEELSEKISSDNSPDLCDKVDNTYPYLISMNLYEDLTNYIDITSPQWTELTDVIERYSFKGARYFYPSEITVMPQFLIYEKTNYVKYGNLTDPEKLWRTGEWTWDAFEQGAQTIISDPYGTADTLLCGAGVFDSFLASNGVQLFLYNGNRYQNGLTVENADNVRQFISPYKLTYADSFDAAKEMPHTVFLSGDEKTLAELRKSGLTVGAVPYPRSENADTYYCKAVSRGFLVPKGAKNIQSAASFINCSRIESVSEEHRAEANRRLIESGLLRSDVEWLENLRGSARITPLLMDENCFDNDTNRALREVLTYSDSDMEMWYEDLAEKSMIIEHAVDSINAVNE